MIAFRHWTCVTFIANKYIQERQSAVKTISDTSEASRLFDRQSDSEVVRGGQEGGGSEVTETADFAVSVDSAVPG